MPSWSDVRRRLLAGLLGAALLATGCSDDDDATLSEVDPG